jgi:hypothetical protein
MALSPSILFSSAVISPALHRYDTFFYCPERLFPDVFELSSQNDDIFDG